MSRTAKLVILEERVRRKKVLAAKLGPMSKNVARTARIVAARVREIRAAVRKLDTVDVVDLEEHLGRIVAGTAEAMVRLSPLYRELEKLGTEASEGAKESL